MWNQGGGYNESSTMGGGYTQSPGGFASPALSQGGEKKQRTRATQIIPCTVSQMMSASQADEAFRVGDVEVSQVTIVGIIRSTDKSMTNIQYKVDDMTTAPMDVKQWVDTEDPGVDSTVLPPGTYVKVSGNLRSFQNHRSVVAFSVKPLENMNEITSHMLEVVQAHMALGKPQSGAAVGGGGGGMSSNVTPPPRALTESTRGSYAGAHDMVNNGLSANQNQKAQRNKLHHTLLSYFLPLPHYNYDLDESSLLGKVLCLIRGCPEPQGISIQDLKQRLNVMSMAVIKQAVEFLSNEGHIFSTIDEDHFKSTDSDE